MNHRACYNKDWKNCNPVFIMKNILLVFCVLPMSFGCTQQPISSTPSEVESNLRPEFEAEFDRLFLSQEPLRYQDNLQFLSSILEAELNPKDRERVIAKLKEFLTTEPIPRPYAPDSTHTGVASEIAFLRLQAVQVLAEVGTKEDAAFIRNLETSEEEHPLFDEECQKAIEKLEGR